MTIKDFIVQGSDVDARKQACLTTLSILNQCTHHAHTLRQLRVQPHESPEFDRATKAIDDAMAALRALHGSASALYHDGQVAAMDEANAVDPEASEFVCTRMDGCTEHRNGGVVS